MTTTADYIYDKAESGGTTASPTDLTKFSEHMREFLGSESANTQGWNEDTVFTGMPINFHGVSTPVNRTEEIGKVDTTEQAVDTLIKGVRTMFDGEETPDPAETVIEHLQNELS